MRQDRLAWLCALARRARFRRQPNTASRPAPPTLVSDVWAVEGGTQHEGVAQAQLLHNVLLHALRGGGCERHQRQPGQLLAHQPQLAAGATAGEAGKGKAKRQG